MSELPASVLLLRIAVVLAALFDLFALLVLVHGTPIVFTLFMFLGQPLALVSFVLLVGSVLADLRAKELL